MASAGGMIEGRRIVGIGGAGIGALRVERATVPEPGAGEVLVQMRAATLNYRDLIGVRGLLPGLTKEPDYVPLSCACAEVTALGAGVDTLRVGDRVMPLFDQGWMTGGQENMSGRQLGGPLDGVARDFAILPERGVVAAPDALGDFEVATLPCAGITAWSALFVARTTAAGDVVVVQGTGGVSIAALQFAKSVGARVFVTSSSDAKLARAGLLGADHLVNYRSTPDWPAAVRAATGGRGADVLLDVVGASQLEQSASALAPGGIIAAIGMLEGGFSWGKEAAVPVVPIAVGNREQAEAMLAACVARRVRPVIDRVYPLDRLGDGLRAMEQGEFFGKIGISFA